jgi:hypothetical protein
MFPFFKQSTSFGLQPTITSIYPAFGTSNGGTSVTLSGTNFDNVTSVTIGGLPITSLTVVNSDVITGVTAAGPVSNADVIATNSSGGSSILVQGYTYMPASGWTLALYGEAGVTTSDGYISTWNDQSGNGNDFTASAVAPTWNANGIGTGRGAATFYAGTGSSTTSTFLSSPSTLADIIGSDGYTWTVYAIIDATNASNGNYQFFSLNDGVIGDTNGYFSLCVGSAAIFDTETPVAIVATYDTTYRGAKSPGLTFNNPILINTNYDGYDGYYDSLNISINSGNYNGGAGSAYAPINTSYTMQIGNNYNFQYYLQGQIAAIFAWDSPLSYDDDVVIRTFFQQYYSIPNFGAAPTITSIFPTFGSSAGGTFVTLTGTGFNELRSIDIGGYHTTNMVVVSNTVATCTTAPGAVSNANVVATGPGGSGTLPAGFTYMPNAGWTLALYGEAGVETLDGYVTSWSDQSTGGDPFSGNTASLTFTNSYTAIVILTGGSGFSQAINGLVIYISNSTTDNNGTFVVTYISPTSVSWINPAGATDNSGAVNWSLGFAPFSPANNYPGLTAPTWNPNGINFNRGAANFVANANNSLTSTYVMDNLISYTAWSLYTVVYPTAADPGTTQSYDTIISDAAGYVHLGLTSNNGNSAIIDVYAYRPLDQIVDTGGGLTFTGPVLVSTTYYTDGYDGYETTGPLGIQINRGDVYSGTIIAEGPESLSPYLVSLGVTQYLPNSIQGQIAAVFAWSTNLSTRDDSVVRTFLQNYYSISLPTISSINIDFASANGGESRVLTGSNLGSATVTVDGNSATVTANSNTSITFTVPASSVSSSDGNPSVSTISVMTPSGTASTNGTPGNSLWYLPAYFGVSACAVYSAQDVTVDGSNNVLTMVDQSGNGYDIASGFNGDSPPLYYATGGGNGSNLPYVYAADSSRSMGNASYPAQSTYVCEWAVAFGAMSTISGAKLVDMGAGGNTQEFYVPDDVTIGQYAGLAVSNEVTIISGSNNNILSYYDGTTASQQILNGSAPVTGTNPGTLFCSGGICINGYYPVSGYSAVCNLFFVARYQDMSLSIAGRLAYSNYFANQGLIPGTPTISGFMLGTPDFASAAGQTQNTPSVLLGTGFSGATSVQLNGVEHISNVTVTNTSITFNTILSSTATAFSTVTVITHAGTATYGDGATKGFTYLPAGFHIWRADIGFSGSWLDQGDLTANNTAGGTAPTLITGSAINGLPALSFDGATQFLPLSADFSSFTEGQLFCVMYTDPSTNPGDNGLTGYAATNLFLSYANVAYIGNGSTTFATVSPSPIPSNTPFLYEIKSASNAWTWIINGAIQATQSVSVVSFGTYETDQSPTFGANNGAAFFGGLQEEIILFDSILSLGDRSVVTIYLYGRTNISGV